MDNNPLARELVLVGGGHSHVLLLRMLGMNPIPGLRVILISPETSSPYSGMLPGLIAGHYTVDEVYIDLLPLCRFAGVTFIQDRVTSIDPVAQTVTCTSRSNIRYDVLSLDIGITPSLDSLPSSADVIPVKPIGEFLDRWQSFLDRFNSGKITDIGFVGAGAGGVELCLAVEHHLRPHGAGHQFRLHLFTDTKVILPEFNLPVRDRFQKIFVDRGITVHREFAARDFDDGELVSTEGRRVGLDEVFWVTRAAPQSWLAECGLPVDGEGFVAVADTLQSTGFDNIFAAGDCAAMVNHPRPKAGVFAVRQGKPLFTNVRRVLLGQKPRSFSPQKRFLALISTGGKNAVASRNGLSLAGGWVWRWKNWIDKRFMRKFSDLPEMTVAAANALTAEFDEQMQCGGCGSKISADLLDEVLTELGDKRMSRDDAAVVHVPEGQLLIQSVDHFRSFFDDPYILARIAVCHAVSDIYACGGRATTAMALLTLPFARPAITRSLLRDLLKGTLDQLEEEGMSLIGGHTSEGQELALGFTVNGVVEEAKLWRKTGLQVGDKLILTKPLGTGTIFAADMQYKAKGEWVTGALDVMMSSNRAAKDVFRNYHVSACTDVTGFGLAGHCREMLNEAGSGMTIEADKLPILPGALSCLNELGVRSTLHEANRAAAGVQSKSEILFDPQTSGGLLAAVKDDEAKTCVSDLEAAGYADAAIIGEITRESGINVS